MYWWKLFALIVIGEFIGNFAAAMISVGLKRLLAKKEAESQE